MISSGKRRVGSVEQVTFGAGEASKRRKKEVKKQSGFKPQPIINSSDTPPEELASDLSRDIPPPPPSERKIARRRESTRHICERSTAQESPSPSQSPSRTVPPSHPPGHADPPFKKQRSTQPNHDDRTIQSINLQSSTTTPSTSRRPRPSMPRPLSPPKLMTTTPKGQGRMGRPTGFVRKTRKSMMRELNLDESQYQDGLAEDKSGSGIGGFGVTGDLTQESVVPLAENETPMIRKNKELREAQRRSSLGMRGQRASSSLGRGDISIPHSSVDSSIFYKHISPTMPEPIRARHIIAWCAKRALDAEVAISKSSKSKGKEKKKGEGEQRSDQGDRMLKEITEDFIGNLGRGAVDTNVFAKSGAPSQSGMQLRPHPRNVANLEIKKSENIIIKRCKDEEREWNKLRNESNRKQQDVIDLCREKESQNREGVLPDLRDAGWMLDALNLADKIIQEGDGDLSAKGEFQDVEFKVDSLLASTHVALQYSHQAQRFLDGIFASLTQDLRSRERGPSTSALPVDPENGSDPITLLSSARMASSSSSSASAPASSSGLTRKDPTMMLRALAAAESKSKDNEDILEAASRLTPVTSMTIGVGGGSGLNVSVGPGVGATPRRVGQTPRRVVQQQQQQGGTGSMGTTPRSLGTTRSTE